MTVRARSRWRRHLPDRGAGGADGVSVTVWPEQSSRGRDGRRSRVRVTSRHTGRGGARRWPSGRAATAHKIDSTLRGNWARELVARHLTHGCPSCRCRHCLRSGRVCVGGVVLNGGRPVHEGDADARQSIVSSRPAEHLRAAGAIDVVELATQPTSRRGSRRRVGTRSSMPGRTPTSTSWWPCGRARRCCRRAHPRPIAAAAGGQPAHVVRRISGPALVVCGSANPAARANSRSLPVAVRRSPRMRRRRCSAVARAGTRSSPRRCRAVPSTPSGRTPRPPGSGPSCRGGGEGCRSRGDRGDRRRHRGDALLGNAPVRVLGSVAPGTAWLVSPRYRVPVITRAGGFGDDRALVDLLWGTLRS